MPLYDQIKSHFTLPNAYYDWKEYRKQLTNYLITQTNQITLPLYFSANTDEDSVLPTLAIIGAGSCNDIDLNALLPHFSKITLIDYNEEALKTALITYHVSDSTQIECVSLSLNGLNDSHYQDFCHQLQDYIQCLGETFSPAEFEVFAVSKVREYFNSINDYVIPIEKKAYDYVCCFGFHSQLQAMFSYIYHVFEVNLKDMYFRDASHFDSHFSQCLRDENNRFIPIFHDALFSSVKHAVFFGLEKKSTLKDGLIEGAYQALQDIRSRSLKTQEDTLLWPFLPENNILYEMAILKVTVDQ